MLFCLPSSLEILKDTTPNLHTKSSGDQRTTVISSSLDELERMVISALTLGNDYEPNTACASRTSARTISYPAHKTYYVRLENSPLSTPTQVQEIGRMPHLPEVVQDETDTNHDFCAINGLARSYIEQHLRDRNSSFRPTFISVNKASKDLCKHSWAPFLSRDCTMPQ